MRQLVNGVLHFHKTGFREREELFRRLEHGQAPEACLITCADSRIVPSLITNSQPGQLFIVRNVGNIIPCFGADTNGELAAVEYAVTGLGIEDLIVCGHTGCGAMQALLASTTVDGPSPPPLVGRWLQHARTTLEIVHRHYAHLQGQALIDAAAAENVLVQLEHLRTLPVVASGVDANRVRLHGWMYKIGSGELFYYEPDVKQFLKFGETARTAGDRITVASRIRH